MNMSSDEEQKPPKRRVIEKPSDVKPALIFEDDGADYEPKTDETKEATNSSGNHNVSDEAV